MSDLDYAIPSYGSEALSNRDIFFVGVSGVHFFVEDEGQENLYIRLMSRCFPGVDSIEVFPQGGKPAVIAHAEAGHRGFSGIRRVYVLDKDFDDLLDEMKSIDGVFYWHQYSIENLLFDEAALVEVCVQEAPREKRCELAAKLGFDAALKEWAPHLDRLHRAYYLVQRFSLGIKNTKCSVDDYVHRGRRSVFDPTKIDQYIEIVRVALKKIGAVATDSDFEEMMLAAYPKGEVAHFNGKYLFDLAYHRMKSLGLVKNISSDSLLYRCAGECSISPFNGFIASVGRYVSRDRRRALRPADSVIA